MDEQKPKIIYLSMEAALPFRVVAWEDLKPGDVFYYQTQAKNDYAKGPFRFLGEELENPQGVKLSTVHFKKVQPLVLELEEICRWGRRDYD